MPIYLFEDPYGSPVESYFHADDAPSIGEKAVIDGKECTRMASIGGAFARRDVKFTSHQIDPAIAAKIAPRVNRHGEPQFQSAREVEEFCAKSKEYGLDYKHNEL